MSWRTGIAPGTAREHVRVARALDTLPRIGEAMSRGELSYAKVRAVTRVATPATEARLLDVARSGSAAQVEKIVRAWRRSDRLREMDDEQRRRASRQLTMYVDDDGSFILRGRLDPEVGAVLERALAAASTALFRQEAQTSTQPRLPTDPTPAQRRGLPVLRPDQDADALGVVAEWALGGATDANAHVGASVESTAAAPDRRRPARPASVARADRYLVVLHADVDALRQPPREFGTEAVPAAAPLESGARASDQAESATRAREAESVTRAGQAESATRAHQAESAALAGQAVLDGGARVSAETSRRIACDGSIVRMTHVRDGSVLDVGRRSRAVPTPIRRALQHCDRACRFPGCTNRYCDAHHIRRWADGGATALDNLILLCRRHHTAVHEEGFGVRTDADRVLEVSWPDGRPLDHSPPMPRVSDDPLRDRQLRDDTGVGIYASADALPGKRRCPSCARPPGTLLAGAEQPLSRDGLRDGGYHRTLPGIPGPSGGVGNRAQGEQGKT